MIVVSLYSTLSNLSDYNKVTQIGCTLFRCDKKNYVALLCKTVKIREGDLLFEAVPRKPDPTVINDFALFESEADLLVDS